MKFRYRRLGPAVLAGTLLGVAAVYSLIPTERRIVLGDPSNDSHSVLSVTLPPNVSGRGVDGGGYKSFLKILIRGDRFAALSSETRCGNLDRDLSEFYLPPRQQFVLSINPASPDVNDIMFNYRSELHGVELEPMERREDYPRRTGHYTIPLKMNEDGGLAQFAECPYRNGLRSLCRIQVQSAPEYHFNFIASVTHRERWDRLIDVTSCLVEGMITVERRQRVNKSHFTSKNENPPFSLALGNRHSAYCMDHLLQDELSKLPPIEPIASWRGRCLLKLTYTRHESGSSNYGIYPETERDDDVQWDYGLRTASYGSSGEYIGPRTPYGNMERYYGSFDDQRVILQCMAKDAGVAPWCLVRWPLVAQDVAMQYRFPLEWLPAWKRVHAFVLSNMSPEYSFPKHIPR